MTAVLPNIKDMIACGMDPKTKLPYRFNTPDKLKENIKRVIRIIDEQNAVQRYEWGNLPGDLTGELLERIIYYKAQAAFFYMKETNRFYFLPYALDGTIDVYGRYTSIRPLPFNGQSNNKEWIKGLSKKPIYEVKDYEDLDIKDLEDGCVLLNDYSKQISETVIPRRDLNEAIIDVESEMIPFMRTSCMLGTGVKGMRVNDADQQESVDIASKSMHDAALRGDAYIPIIGNIEFQELTDGANLKGADYMQAMESIDNFRLSTFGIQNGGLFQKKEHMLQDEQQLAGGGVSMQYQNGLTLRQQFCDIVNSIWGLGIYVMPSESVIKQDINGDGLGFDMNNQYEGDEENDTNV